ncbi:hypothetical protein [Streptomyces sp. NPDC057616]|uniref:hypothetical protein n=1 Tax=Streptomyces sp. NPDC057616 TaxID=3346183 RepID=UPI00368894B9
MSVFEIRIICEPHDTDRVSTALAAAFDTGPVRCYPTRDRKRDRLYVRADHRPADGELGEHWPTAQEAYANAPDPRAEFDWLLAQAHVGKRTREWWLRRAAVVDRRSAHLPPDHRRRDEHALELAHFLIELDDATVPADPRAYVRQQYAAFIHTEESE